VVAGNTYAQELLALTRTNTPTGLSKPSENKTQHCFRHCCCSYFDFATAVRRVARSLEVFQGHFTVSWLLKFYFIPTLNTFQIQWCSTYSGDTTVLE